MPLKILQIVIKCGETTCASEPGAFCKYLYTSRFGTKFHCKLFSKNDDVGGYIELEEHQSGINKGWIARHEKCLSFQMNKN